MFDFAQARENMVDSQIHTSGVITPAILNAFQNIPRELFVPTNYQEMAYSDQDMPIGKGRYLLDPVTHAKMIEAVAPKASDVVLDIGTGTGYSAAILSPMVTTVLALEEDPGCLEKATQLWDKLDLNNIAGLLGPLAEGQPKSAPYSLIFINGSVIEIPQNIADQLSPGGRLITIIRKPGAVMGQVTIVENLGERQFSSYNLFDAGFPYLPGFAPKPTFSF